MGLKLKVLKLKLKAYFFLYKHYILLLPGDRLFLSIRIVDVKLYGIFYLWFFDYNK